MKTTLWSILGIFLMTFAFAIPAIGDDGGKKDGGDSVEVEVKAEDGSQLGFGNTMIEVEAEKGGQIGNSVDVEKGGQIGNSVDVEKGGQIGNNTKATKGGQIGDSIEFEADDGGQLGLGNSMDNDVMDLDIKTGDIGVVVSSSVLSGNVSGNGFNIGATAGKKGGNYNGHGQSFSSRPGQGGPPGDDDNCCGDISLTSGNNTMKGNSLRNATGITVASQQSGGQSLVQQSVNVQANVNAGE